MIFNYVLTSSCKRVWAVRYFSNHFKESTSLLTKKLYEWKQPSGHNTGIQVANSYKCLDKENENVPLVVGNPTQVSWYACGPTVYDEPHIGNAATYVRFDVIRRILINHFNLEIDFVMGITDIDDKIIHRACLLDKDFFSMARFYEDEFKKAMCDLNILPPTMYIRVSEIMPKILSFVNQLLESGRAYPGKDGSIWFSVDAFTDMGRLTYILDEWESETSILHSEKQSTKDFALWKAAKPGEPYWDAPWGPGRPGWHVECSTMASLVFGDKLDIHSGSRDLLLHHECEIFQSESYHTTPQWVNYFLHAGSLIAEGASAKMSKSLGNIVTVDDFRQRNSADCFRMFCVLNNWNSNLIYTPVSVKSAERKLNKLQSYLGRFKQYVIGNLDGEVDSVEVARLLDQCKKTVHSSLCNNFNIAQAIATMQEVCKKVDLMFSQTCKETWQSDQLCVRDSASVLEVYRYVTHMFQLFGFNDVNANRTGFDLIKSIKNSESMHDVQDFRNSVRKIAKEMKSENIAYANRLFDACDKLRSELNAKGSSLKDPKI